MFKRILFLTLLTSGLVFSQNFVLEFDVLDEATNKADYALVPSSGSILDIGGASWTIECRFKVDMGANSPTPVSNLHLISQNATGTFIIYLKSANLQLATFLSGSAQGPTLGEFTPTESNWYHVALTCEINYMGADDRLQFYVDGVATGSAIITTLSSNTNTFNIGASKNATPIAGFEGQIDEVRFWDDVRTPTEILNNKDGVVDPASANLAAYYRLDEGSGTTVTDATSGAKHGVLGSGDYLPSWNAGGVLPVELTSFSAIVIDNGVELKWETATEVNNYGFEVQRSAYSGQRSEFESVGFVDGAGNSNSPREYSFIDDNPLTGTAQYRLKQVDIDGSYDYSDAVEISFTNSPTEFTLDQNYPNPFNPSTVISWQSPVGSHVRLSIYDVLGKEVALLVNEYREAGIHQEEFKGADLPSGIYFYVLSAAGGRGHYNLTQKMLLLK